MQIPQKLTLETHNKIEIQKLRPRKIFSKRIKMLTTDGSRLYGMELARQVLTLRYALMDDPLGEKPENNLVYNFTKILEKRIVELKTKLPPATMEYLQIITSCEPTCDSVFCKKPPLLDISQLNFTIHATRQKVQKNLEYLENRNVKISEPYNDIFGLSEIGVLIRVSHVVL